MAVALGCSPDQLLDLELALFDATAAAFSRQREAESWTQTHELLATIAELTSALTVVTIKANSKGNPSIEPLKIPRPSDRAAAAPEKSSLSHTDLARMLGGG